MTTLFPRHQRPLFASSARADNPSSVFRGSESEKPSGGAWSLAKKTPCGDSRDGEHLEGGAGGFKLHTLGPTIIIEGIEISLTSSKAKGQGSRRQTLDYPSADQGLLNSHISRSSLSHAQLKCPCTCSVPFTKCRATIHPWRAWSNSRQRQRQPGLLRLPIAPSLFSSLASSHWRRSKGHRNQRHHGWQRGEIWGRSPQHSRHRMA